MPRNNQQIPIQHYFPSLKQRPPSSFIISSLRILLRLNRPALSLSAAWKQLLSKCDAVTTMIRTRYVIIFIFYKKQCGISIMNLYGSLLCFCTYFTFKYKFSAKREIKILSKHKIGASFRLHIISFLKIRIDQTLSKYPICQ